MEKKPTAFVSINDLLDTAQYAIYDGTSIRHTRRYKMEALGIIKISLAKEC